MNTKVAEIQAVLQWQEAQSKAALAQVVATQITTHLLAATSAQEQASILLSGGSTPQAAYQLLANAALPWDKLQISLTDERRVDDGHKASNALMVLQSFLAQHPQSQWFPLWQSGWSCDDIAHIKAQMSSMQKPFDVALLGMGEDGHFASLFPGCEASIASLQGESDELVCTTAPNAPEQRISWSMAALLEAKTLMLYITGDQKRAIVEQACQPGSPASELPIGYLLRALQLDNKQLHIFWCA